MLELFVQRTSNWTPSWVSMALARPTTAIKARRMLKIIFWMVRVVEMWNREVTIKRVVLDQVVCLSGDAEKRKIGMSELNLPRLYNKKNGAQAMYFTYSALSHQPFAGW